DTGKDALHPAFVDLGLCGCVGGDEFGGQGPQALQCVEGDAASCGLVDRRVRRRPSGVEVIGELFDGVTVEIVRFHTQGIGHVMSVVHRHCSIRTMMSLRARARSPRTVERGTPSSSLISSYVYPPISRSTQHSRCGAGTSCSASLNAATPARASVCRAG